MYIIKTFARNDKRYKRWIKVSNKKITKKTMRKAPKGRKAPSQKANTYKNGTKKQGMNGLMYVVKSYVRTNGTRYKRWVLIQKK